MTVIDQSPGLMLSGQAQDLLFREARTANTFQEGVDKEFFPGGKLHTLVVVNIGKPGENSWLGRLPRLDCDEVVTTIPCVQPSPQTRPAPPLYKSQMTGTASARGQCTAQSP
ncbi:MAG TPA: hypothetical protein VMA73_01590 [Streptosporangiaceae bacterium]|nr:hypothetical protein [Streptosporangiaceae bacterium]